MNDKKLNKLLEQYKDLGITRASEATKYTFYDTPFATVNSLIGGIPIGRFTTLAGPEHTGKGAFSMQLLAHLQARDPEFICLWTDAENAFDESWATKLGVDLTRVLLQKYTSTVNSMELLLDQSLNLIKNTKINLWIVDSIGALLPKNDGYEKKGTKYVDKSLEGTNMLNLQRKLGEFYRKANIYIAPRPDENHPGTAVIMVGQIYTVPTANATINEVKGGNAVKHWAHLRLMMRRGPRSDWPDAVEIKSPSGQTIKVFPGWSGRMKVEKTRINANEGQEVLIPFTHGKGFDSRISTINSAFGLGIIERAGGYYKNDLLPDGQIQGKDNAIAYFNENEEAYEKLYERVMNIALQEVPVEELEVVEVISEEEIDT